MMSTRTFKNNDERPWGTEFSLGISSTGVVLYAIVGVVLMVVFLIVKLLRNTDDVVTGEENAAAASESSRLLSPKEENLWYGATGEEEDDDLESGGKLGSSSSSCEDLLYDAKICVICYDQQRNCLFIPCGHCVSCFTCADRIMSEEIKSCPICRSFINKVAKLHIL